MNEISHKWEIPHRLRTTLLEDKRCAGSF